MDLDENSVIQATISTKMRKQLYEKQLPILLNVSKIKIVSWTFWASAIVNAPEHLNLLMLTIKCSTKSKVLWTHYAYRYRFVVNVWLCLYMLLNELDFLTKTFLTYFFCTKYINQKIRDHLFFSILSYNFISHWFSYQHQKEGWHFLSHKSV